MNHCVMQRNAFTACEEVRSPFDAGADRMHPPVFCPKPRRLGPLAADPVRHLRWYSSHQVDPSDSKAGAELLDIFLSKGEQNQVASSPPFFCGSPPSRAANPIVQDERFGEDRPPAPFPIPALPLASSGGSPMSPRKGCVRAKFGLSPAAVRIEGFDCLNRDRRSCSSITAVA